MAKKAPKDAGKEFLAELVALIPEDKRAGVAALLEDETVLTRAGEHTLRQEDYSRLAQNVQQTRTQQEQWWAENQAKVAEYEALVSTGKLDKLEKLDAGDDEEEEETPKGRRAKPQPDPNLITRKEAEDRLNKDKTENVQFSTYLTDLSNRHYHTYKEPLDTTACVRFCRENNIYMDQGGYELFTKDLRDKAAATAAAAHEAQIRQDERRKTVEEISAKGPGYPIAGRSTGPDLAPLDEVLARRDKDKPGEVNYSAAEAAREYNKAVFSGGV